MTLTTPRVSLTDLMAVTIPEGTHGSVAVERFEVPKESFAAFQFGARAPLPGTYTRLMRNRSLWMSDTHAERRDHMSAAIEMQRRGGRVLVGGLGLGMIVQVALSLPDVTHVDVVEVDADVIALIGPHYEAMAEANGKTLAIHHDDLYAKKWAPGTRWNVAWFDIWRDLCTDNLTDMAKLARSYGRRTDWHGCWGKELLRYQRDRDRRSGWY